MSNLPINAFRALRELEASGHHEFLARVRACMEVIVAGGNPRAEPGRFSAVVIQDAQKILSEPPPVRTAPRPTAPPPPRKRRDTRTSRQRGYVSRLLGLSAEEKRARKVAAGKKAWESRRRRETSPALEMLVPLIP